MNAMTQPVAHVLHEAVAAIYFDDSSDFKGALWKIVRHLAPELVGTLETSPALAFEISRQRLVGSTPALAVECPICAGTKTTFGKRCECAQENEP